MIFDDSCSIRDIKGHWTMQRVENQQEYDKDLKHRPNDTLVL